MKRQISVTYLVMCVLMTVCLIASNIFTAKVFSLWGLVLTGDLVIFPVSYILNDCISEIYGYRRTRLAIWIAFAMNFFFVLVAQAVTVIAEACDISNGFLNWGFSWKQIAAESREPAEKDTSPKAVLERLGAKQEAIGEGWTVIEGENDSDWVLDKKAIETLTKLIRVMPSYMDGLKDELGKLKSIMTNFPAKKELVTRIKELRVEALILETALKNTSAAPETDAETRRKFLQDVRELSEEVNKLLYEAMMRMPDSAFRRPDVGQAGVGD